MKNFLTSVLFLALTIMGLGCSHVTVRPRPTTIVIDRPENNGSVNILPCALTFSSGQSITLSGGETVSVAVWGASRWVEASSIDPYHPENPDTRAWHSRRMALRLKPGEVVRLLIEPRSKGSVYVGGWTIEKNG